MGRASDKASRIKNGETEPKNARGTDTQDRQRNAITGIQDISDGETENHLDGLMGRQLQRPRLPRVPWTNKRSRVQTRKPIKTSADDPFLRLRPPLKERNKIYLPTTCGFLT